MKIELTGKDQKLLLKAKGIDPALRRKMSLGRVDGSVLVFDLSPDEIAALLRAVKESHQGVTNPKTGRALLRLLGKLSVADGVSDSPIGKPIPTEHLFPNNPEDELERIARMDPGWEEKSLGEKVQALGNRMEFADIGQLEAAVRILAARQNRIPQDDFGGLTPEQVHLLINSDWGPGTPGVQLRGDLTADEALSTPVIDQARILLTALGNSGPRANGTRATTAGYLNRKFVGELLELSDFSYCGMDTLRSYRKIINESDVPTLEDLRVMLEMAGLISLRKQTFKVSRLGLAMLPPERAAELYHRLFETKFQRVNLGYGDRLPELPEFQDTLGYSLYRLGALGPAWSDQKKDLPKLLIPTVSRMLPPAHGISDPRVFLLRWRFLNPLEIFGLVEIRTVEENLPDRPFKITTSFRPTALFDRFIRFHFG